MPVEIGQATKIQIGDILDLMLSGVTSDPVSMGELARSWWRRLFFRRWFGPRLLANQMDTFVATRDGRILGFVVVQYSGETAGTFDWAFREPWDDDNREIFADLLDTALDQVVEQGDSPYFYFGFATDSPPEIKHVLEEVGLYPADYQLVQMTGPLPLAERLSLPDDLHVSLQVSQRFQNSMAELIPLEYPHIEAPNVAVIVALHEITLQSSKVYLVKQGEEAAGFVQQFHWRDELRLLFALRQALWGTETERRLVAALAGQLRRRYRRLRVRTFSRAHLEASRESLASLGLSWEPAPWQRWIGEV